MKMWHMWPPQSLLMIVLLLYILPPLCLLLTGHSGALFEVSYIVATFQSVASVILCARNRVAC